MVGYPILLVSPLHYRINLNHFQARKVRTIAKLIDEFLLYLQWWYQSIVNRWTLTRSHKSQLLSIAKPLMYYSYTCNGGISDFTRYPLTLPHKSESLSGSEGTDHSKSHWEGFYYTCNGIWRIGVFFV